jgi:hypothetical protein
LKKIKEIEGEVFKKILLYNSKQSLNHERL